ncbi:MAG: DUF4445 domain-containing protein [Proteobacteria bacterium]|nr:DUF4445 domain-containing protein [Pseudomonadota bacterium]MBI3499168.1 DUF4445 domain-containing protein [Pseudomonadota bacterium]
MPEDALVAFMPSGKRGRFPLGTSLLDAARALGVDLDSVCGGRGICGRCQVRPSFGEFAKLGVVSASDHLSLPAHVERAYADRRGLGPDRRLGCSATISGDVVVDVPPESQVHRQLVRKRPDARPVEIDPMIHLHYVEVQEPDMHDPSGDFRRLASALEREWGITDATIELGVLAGLQKALRQGAWKVTAAVRDRREVVAVWPGFREKAYGLAVDVGSTTIAVHLTDLSTGDVVAQSGAMNPQIRFGEDLMSRVSYVMMNPGGDVALTEAVRQAIDAQVGETTGSAGLARADVLEAVLVGNPVMHHLLLGLDPTELGGAPFALALDHGLTMRASDLGLALHPGAKAVTLPCIAGHVGADTAAVILSEGPHLQDEMMLVVDVGTNAEIVLGNRQRLLAASSPTGPAFEGAQISCGQRAAPGAVERVRIDRETLEPRFKVIGADLWSNEPGFAEKTKATGVTGICGSGIIEVLAEMFLAGVLASDGTINGAMAAQSPRVIPDGRTFAYLLHAGSPALLIHQNDVRAIQLAKAALYAGAKLLMDRMGVDAVDRIVLAGAFGSHIDPLYAMTLGMIPDCEPARVSAAGNAAGTGARIALVNRAARAEIAEVVRRVEKVETAIEPMFQAHFVEAMALPHKTAPYPRLRRVMTLPEPMEPAERGGRRRRRQGS